MSFNPFQSLFGGGNADRAADRAQVQNISGGSAVQFFNDKDTVFVDVRGQGEISSSGTIKGAVIAPLPEFARHARADGSGSLPGADAGKRIILVCASGARSGMAAKMLLKMGYDNVTNVSGGIGSWLQAGGPSQR